MKAAYLIPLVASLLAFLGTAITGVLTYQATKRTKSGNIRTTEADRLWAASERMRDDLQNKLDKTEVKLEAALLRIDTLEDQVDEAMAGLRLCEQRENDLRRQLGLI